MRISLIEIKISKLRNFIRFLNLISIFIPVFFVNNSYFINHHDYLACWSVGCILVMLIHFNLFKRYISIGKIYISDFGIEIRPDEGVPITFSSTDKLNIYMVYRGYKSEFIKDAMSVRFRDGVGSLEIKRYDTIYKYDFVANYNCYANLITILNKYKDLGSIIDLRKD